MTYEQWVEREKQLIARRSHRGMGKTILAVLFVAVALWLLFYSVGCRTQRVTYATAERSLALAADAVKAMAEQDLVTDPKTLLAMKASLFAADDQLDVAREYIRQGQDLDAKFYTDAVFSAAQRILTYYAEVEARKK